MLDSGQILNGKLTLGSRRRHAGHRTAELAGCVSRRLNDLFLHIAYLVRHGVPGLAARSGRDKNSNGYANPSSRQKTSDSRGPRVAVLKAIGHRLQTIHDVVILVRSSFANVAISVG